MARTKRVTRVKARATTTSTILAWEDDPLSLRDKTQPIERPVPALTLRLQLKIRGPESTPQHYSLGTSEFRHWTAAEALRRGADLWTALLPANTRWFTGKSLPVTLDAGEDFNAFYDRKGLSFFHGTAAGVAVFSGESPDVVCHELGHAVLDALRPQLWDAASDEVAAFHESFGDMSAILSGLQLESLRKAVVSDTHGKLYRSSRLSRLAEQLGWAIRQIQPDAAEMDCLRNAVNSLFYQDPQTLPPDGPASRLTSEPHSFSRVFTGGFFEALAGMFRIQRSAPNADDLAVAARDMGKLLVTGIAAAPVVPDYYSQVAAQLIAADDLLFKRKYRDVLKGAFVRRGILSLEAAAGLSPSTVGATRSMVAARDRSVGTVTAALPRMHFSANHLGLGRRDLVVAVPAQPRSLHVSSAAIDLGPAQPPAGEKAALSFINDLFRRGRVDTAGHADPESGLVHPFIRKTHELVAEDDHVGLRRHTFDCGLD